MGVYKVPKLSPLEQQVIALIDALRVDMRHRISEPRRWVGNIRRMTLAKAIQGSNSIEGYNASLDDVVAGVENEPMLEVSSETEMALTGYRDAMTYVLAVVEDEQAHIDEGLIKSLHFMMLKHDLGKSPGRWRPGYIAVYDQASRQVVYEGPDAEDIESLIAGMLHQLNTDGDCPTLVKAAMAHLNLVMIHPFRDGNGRMARCLQTLILARENISAPVFSSVEEYLGANTQAYYQVLAEVGQGEWNPQNSALPWIRFCLTAHYRQAKTHLRRIEETEELWRRCSEIARTKQLPERVTPALMDAALGFRLRNSSYRHVIKDGAGEDISELTASRDLKTITTANLLQPIGERRGRYYVAGSELTQVRQQIRAKRPPREEYDPFLEAAKRLSS